MVLYKYTVRYVILSKYDACAFKERHITQPKFSKNNFLLLPILKLKKKYCVWKSGSLHISQTSRHLIITFFILIWLNEGRNRLRIEYN